MGQPPRSIVVANYSTTGRGTPDNPYAVAFTVDGGRTVDAKRIQAHLPEGVRVIMPSDFLGYKIVNDPASPVQMNQEELRAVFARLAGRMGWSLRRLK